MSEETYDAQMRHQIKKGLCHPEAIPEYIETLERALKAAHSYWVFSELTTPEGEEAEQEFVSAMDALEWMDEE